MAALLLGCCFFVVFAAAQEHYLFKRYGVQQGSYEVFQSILEANNQYIGIGATLKTLSSRWKVDFSVFDQDGNFVSRTIHGSDTSHINNGWQGAAFLDRNYVVSSGALSYSDHEPNAYFTRYELTGAIDTMVIFEKDSFNVFSQGKLTPEGDYL